LSERLLIEKLGLLAQAAVDKWVEERGFLLYSGGVDSSVLAALVSKRAQPEGWNLFTLGASGSQDIKESNNLLHRSGGIDFMQFPRIISEVREDEVLSAVSEIKKRASFRSLSHFEDCVAFYLICNDIRNRTKNSKILLLSANGPDELFCGYDRFRRMVDSFGYEAVKEEIIRALEAARILREHVKDMASYFNVTIGEPFFDGEFASFCIKEIPVELKILRGNDMLRKRIWRNFALTLGISEYVANRPKKAMQYSMGIHKVVLSLMKQRRLDTSDVVLQENN
jgi:asparagine synthase (glutamine-hydrolysing)